MMTEKITDKYTGDDVGDMADAFYDDKHWIQAYALYRSLFCANDEQQAELETRMAICCAELGNNGKALEHFQTAYELDTADITGFQNYMYHLGVQGQHDAVIEICTEAIKDELLSQDTAYMAVAHAMRGRCLDAKGYPYQALADLNRGLELGFDDAEGGVAFLMGKILMDDGQYAMAINYFDRVPVESPDYAVATNEIGICHENMGELAKAVVRYKEAVTFAPDDGKIRGKLYVALAGQGDWAGALTHADYFVATMLPTEPSYHEAVRQQAICLRELGHIEAAKSLLEEYLEIEPANYKLKSSLAKVFYECGDIVTGQHHAKAAFIGAINANDHQFAQGVLENLFHAAVDTNYPEFAQEVAQYADEMGMNLKPAPVFGA